MVGNPLLIGVKPTLIVGDPCKIGGNPHLNGGKPRLITVDFRGNPRLIPA